PAESSALVYEWLIILLTFQQSAGYPAANSVASEWLAIGLGESVCLERRCAEHAGPRALSHRRQHPGQILRPSGKFCQQSRVYFHRRYGLRARWWRQLRR